MGYMFFTHMAKGYLPPSHILWCGVNNFFTEHLENIRVSWNTRLCLTAQSLGLSSGSTQYLSVCLYSVSGCRLAHLASK